MSTQDSKMNEKFNKFFDDFETENFSSKLIVLAVGEVSSGKSSFLNAFFDRPKNEPIFSSAARSGETVDVMFEPIGEHILVGDTPGLGDIVKQNSDVTRSFLEQGVDVGILVITGSADSTQKKHYDDLREICSKTIVVLNKIDGQSKKNLEVITSQWRELLELDAQENIYLVSSRGYDPNDKIIDPYTDEEVDIGVDSEGRPRTLRGISDVQNAVLDFLEEHGKILLLAKELKNKDRATRGIIVTAVVSATAASLVPGSAALILGIQATAIAGLYYIYKGTMLDRSHALSLIACFAAEQVGTSLFLIAKSFLPPTGLVDLAAAIIAATVTLATLAAVVYLFKNDIELSDKKTAARVFNEFKSLVKEKTKGTSLSNLKDRSFWQKMLKDLM